MSEKRKRIVSPALNDGGKLKPASGLPGGSGVLEPSEIDLPEIIERETQQIQLREKAYSDAEAELWEEDEDR